MMPSLRPVSTLPADKKVYLEPLKVRMKVFFLLLTAIMMKLRLLFRKGGAKSNHHDKILLRIAFLYIHALLV